MELLRNLYFIIGILIGHYVIIGHGSILKTAALSDKCIVEINDKEIVKNVGAKWKTNDTCIWHSCQLNEFGETYEKLEQEICSANNCTNEFELKIVNGNCCGECIQTKCRHNQILYNVGDAWRSQDNCTILQCEKTTHNSDDSVIISAFQKSCPKITNCPKDKLYEEDCCQYCKIDKKIINKLKKMNDLNDNHETIMDADYYKNHPCNRKCLENSEPMICKYIFTIEWYETLSKACYDCPKNLTDCYRSHCIYGDGVRRSVSVINRMMPGPSIEVCENDMIVVDVKNHLLGESTTIHWHGMHQRDTPYMDGVPHISQCPIQPHATFRYQFKADNSGTHFWHSHTGMQRGDGAFGALIIRQPDNKEAHRDLYDFDLPEHKMIVQDWGHIPGVSMFASHHHSIGSNKPPNILVNGKGRYYPAVLQAPQKPLNSNRTVSTDTAANLTETSDTAANLTETTELKNVKSTTTTSTTITESSMENAGFLFSSKPQMNMKYVDNDDRMTKNRTKRSIEMPAEYPLETFNVVKDFRYRFRIINAEFLNCPVAISVDNHTLLVINSDGFNLEPVEVGSVVTYAGERFDFVIDANQPIGNYWIRFKGLMDCDERFTKAFQVAILHYEGAQHKEPTGIPTYDYVPVGIELNALNKGPGNVDSLTISELNSLEMDNDEILKLQPDFKFYIYYDFYPKDNSDFHRQNLYGFNQVTNTIDNKLFSPQLNHISLKMPTLPLMPARDQIDESSFCNETSLVAQGIDCRQEFCQCSHVLQVPLGANVEFVLIDEGITYDANHPFHLHGNAFRVVGMDRVNKNITVETIREMDKKGLLKRKISRAPTKDTVTVPDGGYTIIRFKADNPGYWLFHCHIEFHAEIGMALVLKVGQHKEMIPVPHKFPTCFDYMPNINDTNVIKNLDLNERNGATGLVSLTSIIVIVQGLILIIHCSLMN